MEVTSLFNVEIILKMMETMKIDPSANVYTSTVDVAAAERGVRCAIDIGN
jgi:hypothetical protein